MSRRLLPLAAVVLAGCAAGAPKRAPAPSKAESPSPASGGAWEQDAQPEETEVPRARWNAIPASARLKVYSKKGESFAGTLDRRVGEYLWLSLSSGGRKALLPSEIDRIVEVR